MLNHYAPIIAEIIPGFVNGGNVQIPYKNSLAIKDEDVKQMYVYVKNINNPTENAFSEGLQVSDNIVTIYPNTKLNVNGYIDLKPASEFFKPNNHYEFAISYNAHSPTSYSSIGKCIDRRINLYINELSTSNTNNNKYCYVGQFEDSGPRNEDGSGDQIIYDNLREFSFELYRTQNGQNTLLAEKRGYHKDEMMFIPGITYHDATAYNLVFTIVTQSYYTMKKEYNIVKGIEKNPNSFLTPKTTLDYEEGRVKIDVTGKVGQSGNFIIERSDDNAHWEQIKDFYITPYNELKYYSWFDNTVSHGKTYYYAIREKFNESSYSKPLISKPLTVYFEDMFLSDSEKQLKIQFNPNVSSLKTVVLETKQDTIDGKYPYFFRNGKVGYKELPITGLISYHMDRANTFNSKQYDYSINLSDSNIMEEREFKISVLDWLNNGKPKLFRSPMEGSYILRLMNVSLAPEKVVNRMLHTFSATGYEVADLTQKNLNELGLFDIKIAVQPDNEIVVLNTISASETYEYRNVKNIIWNTDIPSEELKIELDGQIYTNISGTFSTPQDVVYESFKILNNSSNPNVRNLYKYSTFTFSQEVGIAEISPFMLRRAAVANPSTTKDEYFSYQNGISEEAILDNLVYTYVLSAYVEGGEIGSLLINDEEIQLTEAPRVYKDITTTFRFSGKAKADIYAAVYQEV